MAQHVGETLRKSGKPLGFFGPFNNQKFTLFIFVACRMLIEEFSDNINAYDFQKMTALHLAAKRGHAHVVEYLLNHKANLDVRNAIGQTPLHVAAQAGCLEAAAVLLRSGADPNSPSDHDLRPIHRVSKRGFHELANLLLKAGADLHLADSFLRESAIHHAAMEGHTEVIRLLMCNAKRSLDDTNIRGETALHMAATNNHPECCRLLLTMGITPKWRSDFLNRKDLRQEETALHRACALGHTEVARLLLDARAVPDIQNISGRTPLHFAAGGQDALLVTYLLRAGADHLIVDYDGAQPAQLCQHSSQEVRRAFSVASGAASLAQHIQSGQRHSIVEAGRRRDFLEERRLATGARDAAELRAKQQLVNDGRRARALQARIAEDRVDLCERLRRAWAQRIIARAYLGYRTAKEERVSSALLQPRSHVHQSETPTPSHAPTGKDTRSKPKHSKCPSRPPTAQRRSFASAALHNTPSNPTPTPRRGAQRREQERLRRWAAADALRRQRASHSLIA